MICWIAEVVKWNNMCSKTRYNSIYHRNSFFRLENGRLNVINYTAANRQAKSMCVCNLGLCLSAPCTCKPFPDYHLITIPRNTRKLKTKYDWTFEMLSFYDTIALHQWISYLSAHSYLYDAMPICSKPNYTAAALRFSAVAIKINIIRHNWSFCIKFIY